MAPFLASSLGTAMWRCSRIVASGTSSHCVNSMVLQGVYCPFVQSVPHWGHISHCHKQSSNKYFMYTLQQHINCNTDTFWGQEPLGKMCTLSANPFSPPPFPSCQPPNKKDFQLLLHKDSLKLVAGGVRTPARKFEIKSGQYSEVTEPHGLDQPHVAFITVQCKQ